MKRRDFFGVLGCIAAALGISSVAEARDHGDLEGLAEDDHLQYPLWTQEMADNVNFLLQKLKDVIDHSPEFQVMNPMNSFQVSKYKVFPWVLDANRRLCRPSVGFYSKSLDIFTTEQKVHWIEGGLSALNEMPPFTDINFGDTKLIKMWSNEIVQFAAMVMLAQRWNLSEGRNIDTAYFSLMVESPINFALHDWCDRLKCKKRFENRIQ